MKTVILALALLATSCGTLERHQFTPAELAELDGELYFIDDTCQAARPLCFGADSKTLCGGRVLTCVWADEIYAGQRGQVTLEFVRDQDGCWSLEQALVE